PPLALHSPPCYSGTSLLPCPGGACRSVFSHCYGHPRDLRSFPTRRSSDLVRRPDLTVATEDHNTPTQDIDRPIADPTSRKQIERSEEHTSELQSRENLVCRLLLEKKKQQHP